jgi:ubiquitin-conjugating enzyme E2 variant
LVVLLVGLAQRVVSGLTSPGAWYALLVALPLGYLSADFTSGLVHWFCDTFYAEDSPLIGRLVIHPFREHHRDPLAITRHGFLEVNGNNCLILIPLVALCLYWGNDPNHATAALLARSLVLAFCSFTFATNQFHKWAHASQVSAGVAWLQRHRLILSPEHHALHHGPSHGRAYCVTTGWMNPLLDRLGFFAGCERLARATATGLRRGARTHGRTQGSDAALA